MILKKSISWLFSVLLVFMFFLAGVLPAQSATAVAVQTADLSTNDWFQIKALLPASVAAGLSAQQAYLKASNTGQNDGFGSSISLSGDTLVIGAPQEDSNAVGVNGDGANNSAPGSGAVYVFIRNGGVWSQQAYLKASNTGTNDVFGWDVSIFNDTLVVGAVGEDSNATGVNGDGANNLAMDSGAAYVFTRSGTTWSQQAYLKASNTEAGDRFGTSVSIYGATVVVGASGESSNATGVNGNQANNSTSNSGAAYVFTRSSGVWSQQAYLKASNTGINDSFGNALSFYNNTLAVGAYREASNATGVNGDQADNSLFNPGAAYVFIRSGTTWSQQAYLKASNTDAYDTFGFDLSLSGNTLVVGARGEASNATGVNGDQANNSVSGAGAAYVFIRSGTTWSQQAYLKASNTGANDNFGDSVSISNEVLVVGASKEDSNVSGVNGNQADNSAIDAGAAYIFVRNGATWGQQAYVKASNTDASDGFGVNVSFSGNTFVLGASGEASNATGVNGNQGNSSAVYSGAGYVFVVPTFADVPVTHSAWDWIERLYAAGITGGCGTDPLVYCPNNTVTRAQMAVFLLRGIYGPGHVPPAATGTLFGDVPVSHPQAAWIEQLSNEGITGGCGSGNYCPTNPATRAQMAIFLLRSKYGVSYAPPAATGTMFGDVPVSHPQAAWIEQLSNEGISGGCGGGNFCPATPVTRAQMAIFLVRTFNLP